jgi:hypothetical protein
MTLLHPLELRQPINVESSFVDSFSFAFNSKKASKLTTSLRRLNHHHYCLSSAFLFVPMQAESFAPEPWRKMCLKSALV